MYRYVRKHFCPSFVSGFGQAIVHREKGSLLHKMESEISHDHGATLVGYVAFRFGSRGCRDALHQLCLRPEMLSMDYIPFSESVFSAVNDGIARRIQYVPEVAHEETEWFVLKVWLSENHLREALNAEHIDTTNQVGVGIVSIRQLRYQKPLPLDGCEHSWSRVRVGPVGVEAWSAEALKRWAREDAGKCAQCPQAGVPIWRSNCRHGFEMYCANCWNSYFKKKLQLPAEDGNRHGLGHRHLT